MVDVRTFTLQEMFGAGDYEYVIRRKFPQKFIPEPMSGCWLWIGNMAAGGYGAFYVKTLGRVLMAHRVSYALHKGELGDNVVMHKCDNRLCVNPDHLTLGTLQDNIQDRNQKNRTSKGSSHATSKITEDDVRLIRSTYRRYDRSRSFSVLGKRFGIGISQVKRIVSRESWDHVH